MKTLLTIAFNAFIKQHQIYNQWNVESKFNTLPQESILWELLLTRDFKENSSEHPQTVYLFLSLRKAILAAPYPDNTQIQSLLNSPIMADANLINAQDKNGYTHLYDALAYQCNSEVLNLLLDQKGIDVNIASGVVLGRSPLRQAAYRGHLSIVKRLVDLGADINAQDNQGDTPLILAAVEGHYAVVEYLLSKKADIDICSNGLLDGTTYRESCTALMAAAEDGNYKLVELLLNHAANPHVRNKNNQTALDLAGTHSDDDIKNLLKNAMSQKQRSLRR